MKAELIQVIESVADEKGINAEEVFNALEDAIAKAGRTKYGSEYDIRATLDRKTGEFKIFSCETVVAEVEDDYTEITLEEAVLKSQNAKIGDVLKSELPPIDFGRVAAQTAKVVIYQKVREAERHKQYIDFKDKVRQVISGVVKRSDFTGVTVDLNRVEAFLRKEEMIPRESFRPGDRIRAYVLDVNEESRGSQIALSRTHPQFLAKLFEQEVPEIYEGIIKIKAAARDPGSKAKIAVYSDDPSIDAVGSCVGVRGSRVQAVVDELQGERIDVINWSPDPATLVVNALVPAEVEKVVVDEERKRVEVVVPDEQLSMAIGRRGQNVRLASLLLGWLIEVMSVSDSEKKQTERYQKFAQLFVAALDVDDVMAHLLVNEGFEAVEEILAAPLEELSSIEGFEPELAEELQKRAKEFLETEERISKQEFEKLGGSKELVDYLPGVAYKNFLKLAQEKILTVDDFAGLAVDELEEIIGEGVFAPEEAEALIMKARQAWFNDENAS